MGSSNSRKRCGAKNRNGKPCARSPVKGGKRCKLHGGASLIGPASPLFKHGRYSKLLPTNIRTKYEESLQDAELLSLREQIAVADARLSMLLESLNPMRDSVTWQQANDVFQDVLAAIRSRNESKLSASINTLQMMFGEGARIENLWKEIFETQEHLRKLKDGERRRLEMLQQTITAQQAFTLLAAILDVVRKHVTDRHALSAIGREVRAITQE